MEVRQRQIVLIVLARRAAHIAQPHDRVRERRVVRALECLRLHASEDIYDSVKQRRVPMNVLASERDIIADDAATRITHFTADGRSIDDAIDERLECFRDGFDSFDAMRAVSLDKALLRMLIVCRDKDGQIARLALDPIVKGLIGSLSCLCPPIL